MEIFLHPIVVLQLLLGGVVGWYPRWPIFRVLTLAFVPLVIGGISAIYYGLFSASGESRGWGLLAIYLLVPAGFVAYGIGMLIGYLLQRIQKSHP